MLKVSHLKKYFNEKGHLIKALDDVSFELPSQGLVFVTGRSGTGKSTLLNLLGGLGKAEQGEIYFNNICLNKLNEKELSFYRNEYVGFMFQDFNLFDDLTVFENVKLALDIKNEDDDETIKKEIERVELKEFIHQNTSMLSVGQKERVALLRALIKKPKILLCDEPTGNLDTKTSTLVLEKLKEESKDKLIVVVTHNLTEAYKYGDRIIKLEEGKIVEDIVYPYNKRDAILIDKNLYINDVRTLNDNSRKEISNHIENDDVKSLRDVSKLYVPVKNQEYEVENSELKEKRLKKRKLFRYHFTFLKKEFIRSVLYVFIGVLILGVCMMCKNFYDFDTSNYLIKKLDTLNNNTLVVAKNIGSASDAPNITNISALTDEEKGESLEDKYYIANITIPIQDIKCINFYKALNYRQLFADFYSTQMFGTIYGVDEEFLKDTYKIDQVEIIDLAPTKPYGIYITDYVYDSFMFFHKGNIKLGGDFYVNKDYGLKNCYINGVIKTNYKDYIKNELGINLNDNQNIQKLESEDTLKVMFSLYGIFNVSYSFEKDFLRFYKENTCINYANDIKIYSEYNSVEDCDRYVSNLIVNENDLEVGNRIYVPLSVLNDVYEKKLTINEWKNKLGNKEYKISYYVDVLSKYNNFTTQIIPTNRHYIETSKCLFDHINEYLVQDRGAAFLNNSKEAVDFINRNSPAQFIIWDLSAYYYSGMLRKIDVLKNFFGFVGVILFASSAFIFVYLGYETIKRLKYQIGVLKGIGFNIKDLTDLYLINFGYTFIIGVVVYSLVSELFIQILNPLLRLAINRNHNAYDLTDLYLFGFTPSATILCVLTLLISLFVGTLIPIIKIRNIKPIDILKRI